MQKKINANPVNDECALLVIKGYFFILYEDLSNSCCK